MKVKTSELIGLALNWAVVKAGGGRGDVAIFLSGYVDFGMYHYSTEWRYGGPIIAQELISLHAPWGDPALAWSASLDKFRQQGATPLIAAMRCFVAAKLGAEVDIPDCIITT